MRRVLLAARIAAAAPDQRVLAQLLLGLVKRLEHGLGVEIGVAVVAGNARGAVVEHRVLGDLLGKVGLDDAHAHARQTLQALLEVGAERGVGKVQRRDGGVLRVALAQREQVRLALRVFDQEAAVAHRLEQVGLSHRDLAGDAQPGQLLVAHAAQHGVRHHIGEHPQRQVDAALAQPADHALGIGEARLVKGQQLCAAKGPEGIQPAVDVDHVR